MVNNPEGPAEFDDSKYRNRINLLEDRLKKLVSYQQQSGVSSFPPPSTDRHPIVTAAGDIQSNPSTS